MRARNAIGKRANAEETMNHLKTYMLLAAMTALFGGVGYLIGGATGMLIALGVAVAMNAFAYWNSDKMVLRHFRAQPIDPNHPDLRVRAYARHVGHGPTRRSAAAENLHHRQSATERLRHRPQS